ncbi:MAG: hypothetical protein ACXAB8_07980 [Promethearchaeota archaeon]|jgi:hypothetical protein
MQEKKKLDSSLMRFIEPPPIALEFSNEDIPDLVDIELHSFDFFFELVALDNTTINELKLILNEQRRLPAALGGYHGGYPGGLYDHTLLVVNFAYYKCDSREDISWLRKVLLTAICHDFGKVHYYGYRLGIEDRKVQINVNDADDVRKELTSRFNLSGKEREVPH